MNQPVPRNITSAKSLSAIDRKRIALTIAGLDPSNGAGVTADLQTFAAHRIFGTSAVTALTVQNTLGVAAVETLPDGLLLRTLEYLFADLPPIGIKIGMLGAVDLALAVSNFLTVFLPRTGSKSRIPIVFDPILRSSSGRELFPATHLEVLHAHLLPTVNWATPNWQELAALTHLEVRSPEQAETAAHHLGKRHPHLHLAVTAGDRAQPTDILRLPSGEIHRFAGEHIETTSTHGTGCAFSAALLSRLIHGDAPTEAVASAKHFVAEALRQAPGIGHGRGPLNLLWPLQRAS